MADIRLGPGQLEAGVEIQVVSKMHPQSNKEPLMVTDERREVEKMRVVEDFSGIYTQLGKETETFAPGIISSFVLLTSRFGHLLLVSRYICSYLPSRTCPSWAFLPNPLFCVYAIFQSCILATLIFLLCIFCIKYVMYSKMFLSM